MIWLWLLLSCYSCCQCQSIPQVSPLTHLSHLPSNLSISPRIRAVCLLQIDDFSPGNIPEQLAMFGQLSDARWVLSPNIPWSLIIIMRLQSSRSVLRCTWSVSQDWFRVIVSPVYRGSVMSYDSKQRLQVLCWHKNSWVFSFLKCENSMNWVRLLFWGQTRLLMGS